MSDLRKAFDRGYNNADEWSVDPIDAGLAAVIEALAAEAEREYAEVFFAVGTPEDMAHGQMDLADWLRAHLDAGRDGEAGR